MNTREIHDRVFDRCNRAAMKFFALGFNVIREELTNDDFGGLARLQWRHRSGMSGTEEMRLPLPGGAIKNIYVNLTMHSPDAIPNDVLAKIQESGRRFEAWWTDITGGSSLGWPT